MADLRRRERCDDLRVSGQSRRREVAVLEEGRRQQLDVGAGLGESGRGAVEFSLELLVRSSCSSSP